MNDKKQAAEQKQAAQKETPPRKPSPTATPERIAAAKAANTAKKQPTENAPTTSSTHNVKVSEIKKAAAAVEADKQAKSQKAMGSSEPSSTEFSSMQTVEECAAAYNEMVQTAIDLGIKKVTPVKKFADVKTGVLACERLHAAIQKAREPETKETDMRTKSKRTSKKTASKKAARAAARTGIGRYDENAKIRVLKKENPFREGTNRHKRTKLIMSLNGQTVATAVKRGVLTSSLRFLEDQKIVKVG